MNIYPIQKVIISAENFFFLLNLESNLHLSLLGDSMLMCYCRKKRMTTVVPHTYKIKHLGMQAASTNICNRRGRSQELSEFQCDAVIGCHQDSKLFFKSWVQPLISSEKKQSIDHSFEPFYWFIGFNSVGVIADATQLHPHCPTPHYKHIVKHCQSWTDPLTLLKQCRIILTEQNKRKLVKE